MPLEPEFREMMTSTVSIASKTGTDKQNKPTYGTPREYWAYVEFKSAQVVAADGNLTRSESFVHMDPTTKDGTQTIVPPISVTSQITVDGRTPRIVSIGYVNDEVGLHHIEIVT